MKKIKRSWELIKTSWYFLMQNRQLLIFPIMSLLINFLRAWPTTDDIKQAITYPFFSLYALLINIVLQYTRYSLFGAFAYCIFAFMEGRKPQLHTGVAAVIRHRAVIFIWVLVETAISSTLIPLVHLILNKNTAIAITGAVGMLVSTSIWVLITLFIMPVIVFENLNAISALKRSISILKGICKNSSILILIVILWLSAISYRYETEPPVFILSILVNTVSFIVEALLLAFSWYYISILYTYALTGMMPNEFSSPLISRPEKAE